MTDQEGLIKMLEDPQLDLTSPSNGNGSGSGVVCLDDDNLPSKLDNWSDDSVPGKWEKIKSTFYDGKTAAEVWSAAKTMPMGMWLDLAQRMAPKQVDVRSVQITAIRVELPPLSGFGDGEIIDVELPI